MTSAVTSDHQLTMMMEMHDFDQPFEISTAIEDMFSPLTPSIKWESLEYSPYSQNSTLDGVQSPPCSPISPPGEAPYNQTTAQGGVPMLPPCRVCSEKASGFHYGANTCEACKVSERTVYM